MKKLVQKLIFFLFLLNLKTDGQLYAAGKSLKHKRKEAATPSLTSTESSSSSAHEASESNTDNKTRDLDHTDGILEIPGWGGMQTGHCACLSSASSTIDHNGYESSFVQYSPVSPPPIKRKKEEKLPIVTSFFKQPARLTETFTPPMPSNASAFGATTSATVASRYMIPHGYGWMRRAPFTLLHAAFNNQIDVTANNHKIMQQKLHRAVDSANLELATIALTKGANPNKVDATGWSPLHYACADARCTEIVRLMITYNADITKQTKQSIKHPMLPYGYTPEQVALENDNYATVEILRTTLIKRTKS
ncbi:ankyrin repeat domain-containing protein [Candidatus Dependentiae bacterium]|nr:ankyrin repeat domain-containing protein [Candidatus Dependentiae bacterium]